MKQVKMVDLLIQNVISTILRQPHLLHASVVGSKLLSPCYPRSHTPFSLMLTTSSQDQEKILAPSRLMSTSVGTVACHAVCTNFSFSQSHDPDLHSRSQPSLKLVTLLTCSLTVISWDNI